MKRGFGFFRGKKGQHTMGLPFGMIFAIFLIVVFVVIVFIVVKYFLGIGSCTSVGFFYNELQDAVNDAASTQRSSFEFVIDLPSEIEKVCFANFSAEITGPSEDVSAISVRDPDKNVFLVPSAEACDMPAKQVNKLDVEEITSIANPYCVDLSERTTLRISKEINDKLVLVE